MNVRLLSATLTTIICCTVELRAQSVVPIGALPTFYNGGFAGEAGVPRIANFSFLGRELSSINVPNYIGDYNGAGTFISIDHFLKKIGSGVAFTASKVSDNSVSNGAFVSVVISPKFSLRGKYTFAPFADFSFIRGHNTYPPGVTFSNFPSDYVTRDFKIKSGFLINTARGYVGLSAELVNYSTDIFANRETWRIFSNVRYTFQTGYTFQRTPESKFSFTPQLALLYYQYKRHDPVSGGMVRMSVIDLMDLSLMFRYSKFIAGVNNSGLILGYQTDKLRLLVGNMYSVVGIYKTINIADRIHFHPLPYYIPSDKYTGSVSVRYVFRKKETVKIPKL
jgi:hypothetical protein